MVVIRLARAGGHKRPFYHMVVTDRRNSRDGRFIERLGFYNPVAPQSENYIEINLERVKYWISQGAQPSMTVTRLVKDFEKFGARPKPIRAKKPKKAEAAPQAEAAA